MSKRDRKLKRVLKLAKEIRGHFATGGAPTATPAQAGGNPMGGMPTMYGPSMQNFAMPQAQQAAPSPQLNMPFADVLTRDYQKLFQRAPDAEGAKYWSDQLASGQVSMADLMPQMAAGAQKGTADYALGQDYMSRGFNLPSFDYSQAANQYGIGTFNPAQAELLNYEFYKGAPLVQKPSKLYDPLNPDGTDAKKEDDTATKTDSSGPDGSGRGGDGGGSVGGGGSGASPGGGRDSSSTDSTGTTGGNYDHGGAITYRRYRAEGGPIKVSPAQREAGNFKKKHLSYQGIPLSIEVQKGQIREKTDDHGDVKWRVKMPADYGYVRDTKDHDAMQTDVFLGPDHGSKAVWIVDQYKKKGGKFDEHKSLLGFGNKQLAMKAYDDSFKGGKKKRYVGAVTEMDIDQYKDWLKHGDKEKPVSSDASIQKAIGVVSKKH